MKVDVRLRSRRYKPRALLRVARATWVCLLVLLVLVAAPLAAATEQQSEAQSAPTSTPTVDVALVSPSPSPTMEALPSQCQVHITLAAPVYFIFNDTSSPVCPTNPPLVSTASPEPAPATATIPPAVSAPQQPPVSTLHADDGFWRQINGTQVWLPTVPMEPTPRAEQPQLSSAAHSSTAPATSSAPASQQSPPPASTPNEQDVAKEYGEWMVSIGGESAPSFLTFAEWKERHLAEQQREEQERRERRRKEKLKEKKAKMDQHHSHFHNDTHPSQGHAPANGTSTWSTSSASAPTGSPQSVSPSQSSHLSSRPIDNWQQGSQSTEQPSAARPAASAPESEPQSTPSKPGPAPDSTTPMPSPDPQVNASEPVAQSSDPPAPSASPASTPGEPTTPSDPASLEASPSPPPVRRTLIPAQADPAKELATLRHRRNFASADCAAQVQRASSQVKFASSILNEKKDRYMLSPCPGGSESQPELFVTIELCSEIKVDTLVLANYEFFSRVFKRIRFRGSKSLITPLEEWSDLGTYLARNMRGHQVFEVPNHMRQYLKYIRIDMLDYYGTEAYCPLSLLRVYGLSHFDGWELEDFEDKRKEQEEQLRIEEEEEEEDEQQVDEVVNPLNTTSAQSWDGPHKTTEPLEPTTFMSDVLRDMMVRSLRGLNSTVDADHAYSAEDDKEFSRWSDAPAWTTSHNITHNESHAPYNLTYASGPSFNASETSTSDASKPRTSRTAPSASPGPSGRPTPGGESIYRSITRRLSALEANATLGLQYMEQSGQMLLDVVKRMDRARDAQVALLNMTNTNEFQALRRKHHIDLQRMLFESDLQRTAWAQDKAELVQRLHLLSSELHFERRMDAVQLGLLCVLFLLVLLTRGTHTSALDRVLRRTPTASSQVGSLGANSPTSPRSLRSSRSATGLVPTPGQSPPPPPTTRRPPRIYLRKKHPRVCHLGRNLGSLLTPQGAQYEKIIEVRHHPRRATQSDSYVSANDPIEEEDTTLLSPPTSPPIAQGGFPSALPVSARGSTPRPLLRTTSSQGAPRRNLPSSGLETAQETDGYVTTYTTSEWSERSDHSSAEEGADEVVPHLSNGQSAELGHEADHTSFASVHALPSPPVSRRASKALSRSPTPTLTPPTWQTQPFGVPVADQHEVHPRLNYHGHVDDPTHQVENPGQGVPLHPMSSVGSASSHLTHARTSTPRPPTVSRSSTRMRTLTTRRRSSGSVGDNESGSESGSDGPPSATTPMSVPSLSNPHLPSDLRLPFPSQGEDDDGLASGAGPRLKSLRQMLRSRSRSHSGQSLSSVATVSSPTLSTHLLPPGRAGHALGPRSLSSPLSSSSPSGPSGLSGSSGTSVVAGVGGAMVDKAKRIKHRSARPLQRTSSLLGRADGDTSRNSAPPTPSPEPETHDSHDQ